MTYIPGFCVKLERDGVRCGLMDTLQTKTAIVIIGRHTYGGGVRAVDNCKHLAAALCVLFSLTAQSEVKGSDVNGAPCTYTHSFVFVLFYCWWYLGGRGRL